MRLSDIAKKIMEADDDRFVSIGYGRYKLKGKEEDDDADVYTKTDSGQFVKSTNQKSDDSGKEKPSGGSGMGPDDFERDFDDSDDEPDYGDTRNAQHFSDEPEVHDEPEGGEWEFTDDTNLWDSNGPGDREEIMKALLKDPEISAKLGDEPYWDDVDLVPDDDEGEAAATLEPGMTFGDMKKQILGKKDESIMINGQKYRPIKESDQRIFKENYDKIFRR